VKHNQHKHLSNIKDNIQDVTYITIGLSSVLRPHQHSIGYMGDGFYKSKDPTNSVKSIEGTNSTQTNQTYNKQT